MKLTPIEAGNRIQIPQEWAAEIGLTGFAALEKSGNGILVHACATTPWDDIFASKLRPARNQDYDGKIHITGDDLLF